MPKAKRQASAEAIESTLERLPEHRPGLPARDSVIAVTAAPGLKYKVIHTREVDAYEKGAMGPGLAMAPVAAPVGDNFSGTARKAAKLSISTKPTEAFNDLKKLIDSLVPDAQMKKHKPTIGTSATSKRVKEEERNVRVSAFLYAASREADNDFHLIIGRRVNAAPELYMTMELSGLPPQNSPSFSTLDAARNAFKGFFQTHAGGQLPGTTYDFYDPPIPVKIEGSLFFDMSHAKGQRPGPPSLKSRMPVIWEVHPITKIVLT
jgi:hypothetical protein